MNLYEHTIIARPDTSTNQIKQIQDKYSKIVEKFEGNIVKTENWGLLNMSYLIKKNKKGNYIHFKIEGNGKLIAELEKNEKIDKNLLRYLTVKVKKFDLETNYFDKKEKEDFKDQNKKIKKNS
jgi:small subunit ribosomal protein S6|tara:strand:- start:2747 stop:3115 length:369 start_codon:yes stop_codon:yes gene_type:complete